MENKFYTYDFWPITIIFIVGILLTSVGSLVLAIIYKTPAFITWLTIPGILITTLCPIYLLRKEVILNSHGFKMNGKIEISWSDMIDITIGFRIDAEPQYGDQIDFGIKEQIKIFYQYRGKTSKIVVDGSLKNYSIIKALLLENVRIKALLRKKEKINDLILEKKKSKFDNLL